MTPDQPWNGPCGLLQIIELMWTKASRGGSGSRVRNAIPTTFVLPLEECSGERGSLFVEILRWSERNEFQQPVAIECRSIPHSSEFRLGCLGVAPRPEKAERLRLDYSHDTGRGGLPDRWYLNGGWGKQTPTGTGLTVGPEEWIQIRDNGRFTDLDTGAWWYRQVTFNAAWCTMRPSPTWFLDHAPTHTLNILADLH